MKGQDDNYLLDYHIENNMKINNVLKKIPLVRQIGKTIKIKYDFSHESREFVKYYIESAEIKGDYRFSIMLLVHSIEKGMCMQNPRPFGFDKTKELMGILLKYDTKKKEDFEYKIGISILFAWIDFFDNHQWQGKGNYYEVRDFLVEKEKNTIISGRKLYDWDGTITSQSTFEEVIFSRHSVRDFKKKQLDQEDINFAMRCFNETPTACNRQMCRVIYIKNNVMKKMLDKIIIGLSGFNVDTVQYFVVVYDLAAFAYSGERQQGMFNAGLCTMNFINGLHARGIGNCCLQWSNKYSEDKKVREELQLKKSERIGIIIGCGYYLEHNVIPCSVRRKIEDVFSVK